MSDEIKTTPRTCAHIIDGGVCVFGTRQWSPAITPPPARCAGCPGEGNPAPDEIKGLVTRLENAGACSPWRAGQPAPLLTEAAAALTLSDEARVRAEELLEKEEHDHSHTVDQRDAAEEALSRAYYLVTGRSPEWSSAFGHPQALAEIDDAAAKFQASESLVRELVEGLRPFGSFGANYTNERGWLGCERDRICDWFGPSDFRKARALILRAEGEGSSVAMSAAPVASQPGCSAAQSLDGGEGR